MTIAVRGYVAEDRAACLALFDRNCPSHFAPDERADFARYLTASSSDYRVCERAGVIVGAFGVATSSAGQARLNWIMVDRVAHGGGIGAAIMDEACTIARRDGATAIHIAASHLSASFFARLGARQTGHIDDGWGPGMHRVDMVLEL